MFEHHVLPVQLAQAINSYIHCSRCSKGKTPPKLQSPVNLFCKEPPTVGGNVAVMKLVTPVRAGVSASSKEV